MDRITLTGVSAVGYHGVFPEERRDGQPFVVDVTCHLDLTPAAETDDLNLTENYGELAELVVAHIERDPVNLIERLAGRIADDVLRRTRSDRVEVTVHKPQAPITVPFVDVSVTVVRERHPSGTRDAVFSLGSNVGDRLAHLNAAVTALSQTEGVEIRGVSGVYETKAVGPLAQPDFLNAVVVARSALPSPALLARALQIEAERGRERTVPHGPRTLDVDLISVGEEVLDLAALTLPHPRAHERAFVLVPWLEVDPAAALPGRGPAAGLLVQLDHRDVLPRPDLRIEF